jgi:hypothetical protein
LAESTGRSEADAAGGTGDDRDAAGNDSGMVGHTDPNLEIKAVEHEFNRIRVIFSCGSTRAGRVTGLTHVAQGNRYSRRGR